MDPFTSLARISSSHQWKYSRVKIWSPTVLSQHPRYVAAVIHSELHVFYLANGTPGGSLGELSLSSVLGCGAGCHWPGHEQVTRLGSGLVASMTPVTPVVTDKDTRCFGGQALVSPLAQCVPPPPTCCCYFRPDCMMLLDAPGYRPNSTPLGQVDKEVVWSESADTSCMFLPKKHGGLDLPSLTTTYEKLQVTKVTVYTCSRDLLVRVISLAGLSSQKRSHTPETSLPALPGSCYSNAG